MHLTNLEIFLVKSHSFVIYFRVLVKSLILSCSSQKPHSFMFYYKHLIYHKIQPLNLNNESRPRFKKSQDECLHTCKCIEIKSIREATYIYVNASNKFRDISSQKSHSFVFYYKHLIYHKIQSLNLNNDPRPRF